MVEGLKNPFSNKMWYAAKFLTSAVFENATMDIVQYISY